MLPLHQLSVFTPIALFGDQIKTFYQVSWFAVGCYYLMVGHKNEHARRYLRYVFAYAHPVSEHFPGILYLYPVTVATYWMLYISYSKATTLERTYGPAWIAYGHSFAVESEHDQAMAAYFTAAQLMKGSVPLCHISTPLSSQIICRAAPGPIWNKIWSISTLSAQTTECSFRWEKPLMLDKFAHMKLALLPQTGSNSE